MKKQSGKLGGGRRLTDAAKDLPFFIYILDVGGASVIKSEDQDFC